MRVWSFQRLEDVDTLLRNGELTRGSVQLESKTSHLAYDCVRQMWKMKYYNHTPPKTLLQTIGGNLAFPDQSSVGSLYGMLQHAGLVHELNKNSREWRLLNLIVPDSNRRLQVRYTDFKWLEQMCAVRNNAEQRKKAAQWLVSKASEQGDLDVPLIFISKISKGMVTQIYQPFEF